MLEEQATRVEELLAKPGDMESKQEEDEVRSVWYCYYKCMDVCTSPVGSIHRRQKWGEGGGRGAFSPTPKFQSGGHRGYALNAILLMLQRKFQSGGHRGYALNAILLMLQRKFQSGGHRGYALNAILLMLQRSSIQKLSTVQIRMYIS